MNGRVDVLAVGMAVADVLVRPVRGLPPAGGLEPVEGFSLSTGGVAATFARDLARLGLSVDLVASVGTDALGDYVLSQLQADGVGVATVRREPGTPTGGTVVLIDPAGERSFLHYPGASLALPGPKEIPVQGYRHLHLGGSPLLPAYDGEPGLELLKRARRAGLSTSLDTVGDAGGPWHLTRLLLPGVDLALPSRPEAEWLSGLSDPEAQAAWLLDQGVEVAAVKLGAGGAYVRGPGFAGYVRPPAVTVVDSTGAGEAFCAGFVYGRIRGWELEETARFAVACGALATQVVGGPSAMQAAGAVRRWMAGVGFGD